jgi:hypothetical protein
LPNGATVGPHQRVVTDVIEDAGGNWRERERIAEAPDDHGRLLNPEGQVIGLIRERAEDGRVLGIERFRRENANG